MDVLLVEDDTDYQFILCRELKKLNADIQIHCVETASEFLKVLKTISFDCVLLDYWLPDANASEVLMHCQGQNLNLPPVVILTAMEDNALGLNLVKLGVQDFITKAEANSRTLKRTIHYAVERQRLKARLEKAQEQEHQMAHYDSLTSLPNRHYFYKNLQRILSQAQRDNKLCALFYIDLDGFKKVNDVMGHSTGDEILKMTANRIEGCVRENGSVARIGGDEFTVIIPVPDVRQAMSISRRILESMREPFVANGMEYFLSASLGISMYPDDTKIAEDLVKNADSAMYRAKRGGKGTFHFYNRSMESRALEKVSLEMNIRKALELGEFEVYYQPQLSGNGTLIVGVEALIRWNHPKLGLLGPEKFINMAEESGLIIPIGEWLMRKACYQCKEWESVLGHSLHLTVNLSMVQFQDEKIISTISKILEETEFDPELLGLEITESCASQNLEYTSAILLKLKEFGLKILIDDFGTGYSSFRYLNQLPIDSLKIDHTFMSGIPEDKNHSTIVSAIVAMAHKLKLKVIAEGIETQAQQTFAENLGCHELQGFLYNRPIPARELWTYIKKFEKNSLSPII